MALSVLSWNIREFGKRRKGETASARQARLSKRLKNVSDHIRAQGEGGAAPDVFALLEIEDMDILSLMEQEFPSYDFSITDGERKKKEIIVAHKRDMFDQVAFTQKRQFDLRNPFLRPGALLSVRQDSVWTNMLFLHTDSGTEARDFGNRYEMFDKLWSLRAGLDKKTPARERLLVMGDLNTMGLQFPKRLVSDVIVDGSGELSGLDELADDNQMRRLTKNHAETWKKLNRNMTSDLDHAIASDQMGFENLRATGDSADYEVRVAGWVDEAGAKRDDWVKNISDHCSLFVKLT